MDVSVARSLAETAAWVSLRLPSEDVGKALRSRELQPPGFPDWNAKEFVGGLIEQMLESPTKARAAVDFIVRGRRAALAKLGIHIPPFAPLLEGGRILCTDFTSDVCGVAIERSDGFLDWEDTPAWDTWFHYEDTETFGGVVACWVPAELVERVQRGVEVIPVHSAWWDDSPPTNFKPLFPRWRA